VHAAPLVVQHFAAPSIRIYAEQFTKRWCWRTIVTVGRCAHRDRRVQAGCGVLAAVAGDAPTFDGGGVDRGGHFAPAEQPDIVVDELRTFFRDLR
jgi:hypothetical protein